MDRLLDALLSNGVVVSVLAPFVLVIDRTLKRPALTHRLWLLLLIKLITPPIVSFDPASWVPVSPSSQPVEIPPPPVVRPFKVATAKWPPGPSQRKQAPKPEELRESASAAARQLANIGRAHRVTLSAIAHVPSTWQSNLAWAWLASSAAWMGWFLAKLRQAQWALRSAENASEPIQQRVKELSALMGLRRAPAVWTIPGAVSPLVWAIGRSPRLLLPSALWGRLEPILQDSLLVHELAHLKRRDHWVRLLELAVLSVYWWNPVAWWASRALRDAEERCCDAWVVWLLPGQGCRTQARSSTQSIFSRMPHLRYRLLQAAYGTFPVSRRGSR